jgi:hypothetical protein
MVRPAPCGTFGKYALRACSIEWCEMQQEKDSHMPASVLAQASLVRASRLPPSLTAIGRYLVIRLTASRARWSLVGWLQIAR